MKFVFTPSVHTCMADTHTPISLYLKIREHFPECILMERNGSKDPHHQYSYICCKPAATIKMDNKTMSKEYPDGTKQTIQTKDANVIAELEEFNNHFIINAANNLFETQGLYGYLSYDAVQFFETIKLQNTFTDDRKTDLLHFSFYSLVLVFDHFKQQLYIIQYDSNYSKFDGISFMKSLLFKPVPAAYPFKKNAEEIAYCTEEVFLKNVESGREHCFQGNVFQVVLSRSFSTEYTGDDFLVYRALRSIHHAPYLFYFDYGAYRLMGASPEAQLIIKDNKATIHPIAGTYKRGNDAKEDAEQIQLLKQDLKENAEHIMLVDLARNDLSKNYEDVGVAVFKDIQQHAYVIHMVSEVEGKNPIHPQGSLKVMADTFPAGTLSGAPKYKAMQLIDHYETTARGFYGGSIGFIGFNGDVNQAIMIRTILSKDQKLFYQAGAGIVANSVPAQELQEVNNKLKAIRTAIEQANTSAHEDFNH